MFGVVPAGGSEGKRAEKLALSMNIHTWQPDLGKHRKGVLHIGDVSTCT
jgi:hypothetical protein